MRWPEGANLGAFRPLESRTWLHRRLTATISSAGPRRNWPAPDNFALHVAPAAHEIISLLRDSLTHPDFPLANCS